MTTKSILSEESVQTILAKAKENLEKDGSLAPCLFVKTREGERLVLSLTLPNGLKEKEGYFAKLGFVLLEKGKVIEEALFLAEGWFVRVNDMNQAVGVTPSLHPNRKETISIMGRNAERSRTTSVIVSFTRSKTGKYFWQFEIAEYNVPADKRSGPVGLIDFLFARAGSN